MTVAEITKIAKAAGYKLSDKERVAGQSKMWFKDGDFEAFKDAVGGKHHPKDPGTFSSEEIHGDNFHVERQGGTSIFVSVEKNTQATRRRVAGLDDEGGVVEGENTKQEIVSIITDNEPSEAADLIMKLLLPPGHPDNHLFSGMHESKLKRWEDM